MIDKSSHVPLYIQLKEHLMEGIVSGLYPAGSQLPTEKELTKSLKLGRATVRAAVAELERDGVVTKRHGIGSFVLQKDASLGFKPLISLSYMLEMIGFKSLNRLEFDREVGVEAPPTREKMPGAALRQIRRVRFADGIPVALEDDYFTLDLYEKMKGYDLTASLAHLLLSELRLPVERIEQTLLLRAPNGEEQALLCASEGEQVIEMTRFLYIKGVETPVSYLSFVMTYDLLQVPFEMFRRSRKAR
ncbi:MAG: GntR family transcriptional regulator [Clostridiaceae bacterium]|nr:GntR family transcriptional regulator [Eubacteriales bacterium]